MAAEQKGNENDHMVFIGKLGRGDENVLKN